MDPKKVVETKLGESDTDLPDFDSQTIYFESATGRWLSDGEWVTDCHTMDYSEGDAKDGK
jgi:hypothetical protein